MTPKTQLEVPLCVVFDVLAWDNFTVTLAAADGQERTLLTTHPEDVETPLWQRFTLPVLPFGNDSQVIFHSYHTPGLRPYSAALDNVSSYNMSCYDVTTGKDAPWRDCCKEAQGANYGFLRRDFKNFRNTFVCFQLFPVQWTANLRMLISADISMTLRDQNLTSPGSASTNHLLLPIMVRTGLLECRPYHKIEAFLSNIAACRLLSRSHFQL